MLSNGIIIITTFLAEWKGLNEKVNAVIQETAEENIFAWKFTRSNSNRDKNKKKY